MRTRIAALAAGLLLLAGLIPAAGEAKPTLLGTRSVSFHVDRDELLVGLAEGTFSKLLFEVQGNDLEMIRVVVTYGNGATDTIPVRHHFRERPPSGRATSEPAAPGASRRTAARPAAASTAR